MNKDDGTKFTTPPVVFVLEEEIETLKAKNKKLRKDCLMFQARYMGLLSINKKLRECVDKLWEIEPDKTEMLDILQKCLKEIDEDE